METVWNTVKAAIRHRIPPHVYKLWIEPLQYMKNNGDLLVLACPNFYIKKWIMSNYMALINNELQSAAGRMLTFSLEVRKNGDAKRKVKDAPEKIREEQLVLPCVNVQPMNGRMLRRDYTFDRFVVGKNSDFAYRAALTVASEKRNDLKAVFIKSNTGMGKSHLSQAVGHKILSVSPKERVFYITAEDFTNEMVHSIRNNTLETFKRRYRENCDVLLIEEVHLLSGRTRTQTELAMTLDYLYESDKKIIFSSCYTPGEIPKMSDHLVSRLSQSVLTVIDKPDFRTRLKILQNKSQAKGGAAVPMDVLEYMASELTENVRQLESGLIGITSRSCLLGVPIDLRLAESVVSNIITMRRGITIDAIKKLVCREFGVTIKDIESKSRKQSIVRPRQIAIFLSRRHTDQPLQVIGKQFNRYHATVIHSINSVAKELKTKGAMAKQVQVIEEKLEAGKF